MENRTFFQTITQTSNVVEIKLWKNINLNKGGGIFLYGRSLGGAVVIDLAARPENELGCPSFFENLKVFILSSHRYKT